MTRTAGGANARAAQAEKTRQQLVDAAIRLFAVKAYSEVGVTDIAKAAGVTHGLIFHYFGTKRGIYLEAIKEAAGQLDAAFVMDPDVSPAEQLRRALEAHVRYLSEHRDLALRLVLGGRGSDPDAWDVFESARGKAIIKASVVMGLDPENPALRITARAAIGALDEACIAWLESGEPFPVQALVESMLVMIIGTLQAAPALDSSVDTASALRNLAGR